MNIFKYNDGVRILDKDGFLDDSNPNSYGRVVDVWDDLVFISNMNMPYNGTYAREPFPFNRIMLTDDEALKKRKKKVAKKLTKMHPAIKRIIDRIGVGDFTHYVGWIATGIEPMDSDKSSDFRQIYDLFLKDNQLFFDIVEEYGIHDYE